MRKNTANVIEAFLSGKSKKYESIRTDGKRIYSYFTVIACRDTEGIQGSYAVTEETYSRTTSQQVNSVMFALGQQKKTFRQVSEQKMRELANSLDFVTC
jgi:hypothetical protein